ncbi:MAG: M16 family metallopeptidase [Paracoccaceae bacterium]
MKKIIIFSVGLIISGSLVFLAMRDPVLNVPDPVVRINFPSFKAVYLIPNSTSDRVDTHLIFQNGEVDNPYTEGLMHYVEHLTWLSATQDSDFGDLGHSNAFTTLLSVAYFVAGTKDSFQSDLNQLLKVLEPFSLNQQFMEEERKIILREYDYSARENPHFSMDASLDKLLFQGSVRGRSILGAPRDIEEFSIRDATALHSATHRLQDAVLVVSGPINKTRLDTALADLSLPDISAKSQDTEFPILPKDIMNTEQDLSIDHLISPRIIFRKLVSAPFCPEPSICQIKLDLLISCLDSGLPGGLAGPLRFDSFTARNFSLHANYLDRTTIDIQFSAEPDTGISLLSLQQAFDSAWRHAIEQGIPEDSFQRIKSRYIAGFDGIIDPHTYAREKLIQALIERQTYIPLEIERLIASATTLEDINSLLKHFDQPGRQIILRATPSKE